MSALATCLPRWRGYSQKRLLFMGYGFLGGMSPFVFTSERGAPFATAGFARMVERAGSEAKLGFKAHPHMLRHACGYALANRGHDTRACRRISGTATSNIRSLFRIGPDAVQGLLALGSVV